MNSSIVLGLFAAVALGLVTLATTETAAGQCDPSICGADSLKKGNKIAAAKLRQTAGEIQGNDRIPDPPKSQVVDELNAKANQLDPMGKPCGTYVPCP
jgi:hypothetical protein